MRNEKTLDIRRASSEAFPLDNLRAEVYNKNEERRCPASAAVMLPPSRHIVPRQEEVQFFVILLTVSNVHTRDS